MTVRTMAHDTSLAVWGVPSPIVIDHPFRIQVGATCSAGCDLEGKEIQICDEARRRHRARDARRNPVGRNPGALLDRGRSGCSRQGGGDLAVESGSRPTELRLPHGGASARFGFETVKPPQHSVTVKVVEKDAGTPVEDAQVRLGVYFAYSDATGLATDRDASGTYSLDVLKTGYEALSRVLEVNGDVTVEVEVAVIPPENPDAYWLFDPTKRV